MEEPELSTDRQLELAQASFAQVLASSKQLDDKVPRFVTAIAFFTVGAVQIVSNLNVLAFNYRLGDMLVPIPGLMLGLFLVLVVLAVVFFILALGPTLAFPAEVFGESRNVTRRSHLFFASIGHQTHPEWLQMWQPTESVKEDILGDYLHETHYVAWATYFKYRRTIEARAVLTLSLLFLALGVVISFYTVYKLNGNVTDVGTRIFEWSWAPRLLAGVTISLFAGVLSYEYWRLEAENPDHRSEDGRHMSRLGAFLGMATATLPLYALALVLPGDNRPARFVGAGVVLLALGGLARAAARVSGKPLLTRVIVAGGGVILALSIAAVLADWALVQICLAIAPILLLEFSRVIPRGSYFRLGAKLGRSDKQGSGPAEIL